MAIFQITVYCVLMPLDASVTSYGNFPNYYVLCSDASLRICYLLWQFPNYYVLPSVPLYAPVTYYGNFPNYYVLCSDASLRVGYLLWQFS